MNKHQRLLRDAIEVAVLRKVNRQMYGKDCTALLALLAKITLPPAQRDNAANCLLNYLIKQDYGRGTSPSTGKSRQALKIELFTKAIIANDLPLALLDAI